MNDDPSFIVVAWQELYSRGQGWGRGWVVRVLECVSVEKFLKVSIQIQHSKQKKAKLKMFVLISISEA